MPADKIHFVDLGAQYRSLKAELDDAVVRAMTRGDFILGEDVAAFEKEFAAFCQAEHCIGVSDGVDALHLALRALNVGPGDEVIVPTHTFIASVLAVWSAGAKPVLVDVDPRYYTMDAEAVARAITPRTRALMPVHLYGQPANMDPLLDLAKKHELFVVEDAAQAHGAEYKGRRCGTLGDIGCFSFYPGKNLGAYGDGGGITTNRADLAEKLRILRNYGQHPKNVHPLKGFNSRLDTVQAAVLRVKLKRLEQWNQQRRHAAERYGGLLAGTNLALPATAPYASHVWHLYVVQTDNRPALQAALDAANIAHGIHYPTPVHLQPAFQELGYGAGSFPVAEAFCPRLVSLPIFPEISEEQLQRVAEACRKA
jgi:dTDP-4-amino-4,6-dideoxygalactose transaminase